MRKVRFAIPAIVVALAIGSTSPASAAEYDVLLPAGVGCEFELGLNITASPHRVFREFSNARTIEAGRGSVLLFTNVKTGKTVSLTSNGSVSKRTFNPDGSYTAQNTGHNVIILFPTDHPAGPSTTLYEGRVVYASTADGEFTLISSSGPTRDICSELG